LLTFVDVRVTVRTDLKKKRLSSDGGPFLFLGRAVFKTVINSDDDSILGFPLPSLTCWWLMNLVTSDLIENGTDWKDLVAVMVKRKLVGSLKR